LLSRTIHINISLERDVTAAEQIAEGINKVLEAVI
jgi:hypothetical protein